jgi:nicotinate-nucleotide adenylyltransferase
MASPKIIKTGLFCGSFNPVHTGHMVIAGYMAGFTDLDEVWFVVSPQNPLKKKESLLGDLHRLAMVNIAIEDDSRFRSSGIEFKLPRPSYTVNTLAALKEKYPNRQFALIMGSDNLQTFSKWRNYEKILSEHKLYIYPRPGFDGGEFRGHPSVVWTEAPLMELSSTFIRRAIAEKKNVNYMLQPSVYKYIKEMHFYSERLAE